MGLQALTLQPLGLHQLRNDLLHAIAYGPSATSIRPIKRADLQSPPQDLQSGQITTREKIHKLVDELPESQLDRVADFIATRGRPGDVVGEWGNVLAMLRGSTVRSMQRLDEQEHEAGHSPW